MIIVSIDSIESIDAIEDNRVHPIIEAIDINRYYRY